MTTTAASQAPAAGAAAPPPDAKPEGFELPINHATAAPGAVPAAAAVTAAPAAVAAPLPALPAQTAAAAAAQLDKRDDVEPADIAQPSDAGSAAASPPSDPTTLQGLKSTAAVGGGPEGSGPGQQPAQPADQPASQLQEPAANDAAPLALELAPAADAAAVQAAGGDDDGNADAAAAAAVAAAAALDPAPDFMLPTIPEEKHAQKPTWRRGYVQYAKTEYLLATLTPSDCSTKRLRPPREWYESLLGAAHPNFVVGAQLPDGSPVSFLLKARAYSYVPAEYYIQGSECKRMFKVLGLQPGDGLKLEVLGRESGIPTTRLTLIPADRNPNAAAILAQAAQQAAKREARLAANPPQKPPKAPKSSSGHKRKMAPMRAADGQGWAEGAQAVGGGQYEEWQHSDGDNEEDEEPAGAGRSSRQRSRKQFGDDFVSGLDEAWAAAQHSDEDYHPTSDYEEADMGDGRRRRRRAGSRSAPTSSGQVPHPAYAWQAPGAAAPAVAHSVPHATAAAAGQGQGQQRGAGSGGMPQIVATSVEGRNVLRIRINRPAPAAPPAAEPAGAAAAAGSEDRQGGASKFRSSDAGAGCPLHFLAGLADDMATPLADRPATGAGHVTAAGAASDGADPAQQPQSRQQQAPVAAAAAAASGSGTAAAVAPLEPVVLLGKKLLRDDAGVVAGAACKLGWEPGTRTVLHISRKLSQFGAAHHDTAAVEHFEVQPAECMVEVTLKLQQQVGRVDLLEEAIMQLLDAL